MIFLHVHRLQRNADQECFSFGFIQDLPVLLEKSRTGGVSHPKPIRPWRIKMAVEFAGREPAIEFERDGESASGRVYAKNRSQRVLEFFYGSHLSI